MILHPSYFNNTELVLYELQLNNDIQDEVIGLSKNDQNRLINQKILAFHEVLPPQLVEVNAVVSSLDVRDADSCPCWSKS